MSEKTYRCAACHTPGWPNLNPGCIPLLTEPDHDGVHALFYCVRSHEMIDFKPDGTQDRFPVDLVISPAQVSGPLPPFVSLTSTRMMAKNEAIGGGDDGSFVEDKTAPEVGTAKVKQATVVGPDGNLATVYLKVTPRFPAFEVPLEFNTSGDPSLKDLVVAKGWRVLAVGQDFNAQLTRFFLRLNPTKEDLAAVGGGDLAELCLSTHANKLAVAAAVCRLYLHREGDYAYLVDPRTVLRIRHGESFPGLNEVHDHPTYSLDLATELKRGTSRWHIIRRQPPSETRE